MRLKLKYMFSGILDHQLIDKKVINIYYDVFFYIILKKEKLVNVFFAYIIIMYCLYYIIHIKKLYLLNFRIF